MPGSCCTGDYDAMFDARAARRQLSAYSRSGPTGTTRRLIDAISATGTKDATVLDIGGGVGVIGLELLAAGAGHVTGVDASDAYVTAAHEEAMRRGLGQRVTVHHGDFVGLADAIEAADIVTLDRVVCCYGDWPALVDASAAHALRLYGLAYPVDRWWTRAGVGFGNLCLRLMRRSFRGYVHPERAIDERIQAAGFARRSNHRSWLWQTALYERVGGLAKPRASDA
jgi:magnesium-protoporphyrin O-methyltransferase